MKEENNIWENQWKQSFAAAELQPSSEVWEKIEQELPHDRESRLLLFYRLAAGLLLLITLGSLLGWYMSTTTLSTKIASFEYKMKELEKIVLSQKPNKQNKPSSLSSTQLTSQTDHKNKTDNKLYYKDNHTQHDNYSSANSLEAERHRQTSEIELHQLYPKPLLLQTWLIQNSIMLVASSNPVQNKNLTATKEDAKSTKPSTNKFWIGVDGSPTVLSSQAVQIDKERLAGESYHSYGASTLGSVSTIKNSTTSNQSYTFSFKTGVELNKALTIETGIQYERYSLDIQSNALWEDNLSQKLYPAILTTPKDIIGFRTQGITTGGPGGSGVVGGTSGTLAVLLDPSTINLNTNYIMTLKNAYQFITIPIKMGYRLGWKNWVYAPSIGLCSDFLVNTNTTISSQKSVILKSDRQLINSWNLSSWLGLSIQYQLKKNTLFYMEPSYKLFFSPITNDAALFTAVPNAFNIGVGIKYIIN